MTKAASVFQSHHRHETVKLSSCTEAWNSFVLMWVQVYFLISCSENPKHLCWVLCPGVGTGISVGWAWFQLVLPGTCCRAELLVPLGQHVWERKWGWGKRSENQPQLWGQRSRKCTRVAGIRAQRSRGRTAPKQVCPEGCSARELGMEERSWAWGGWRQSGLGFFGSHHPTLF